MPQNAASDLGLHCLPITLLWVSRLQNGLNCLCLFLINIFFAIISDAYTKVKSDIANQDKFEMDGYF